MQHVGDPHENAAVAYQRAGDHHIALMQRAEKRIIQHIGVTRLQVVGAPDDGRHGVTHRCHMDKRADPGGDQFRVCGKKPDIVIIAFDHDRRCRDRLDRQALLVVDLPQAVFDDFEGDGIDHDDACGTMAMLPYISIVAVAPGGSQIVVVSRSMTAGPWYTGPDFSVAKSIMSAST